MYKQKSLQPCQLPCEHLSFLGNLLNFVITKYLKQEVDNDLSVSVDERSPCGLSITGQRLNNVIRSIVNDVTTTNGEVPYFNQGVASTAQI